MMEDTEVTLKKGPFIPPLWQRTQHISLQWLFLSSRSLSGHFMADSNNWTSPQRTHLTVTLTLGERLRLLSSQGTPWGQYGQCSDTVIPLNNTHKSPGSPHRERQVWWQITTPCLPDWTKAVDSTAIFLHDLMTLHPLHHQHPSWSCAVLLDRSD